jgi:hypothetical protein
MKMRGIPGFARARYSEAAFLAIEDPHASGIRRQHRNVRRLQLPPACLPIHNHKGAKT